MLRFASLLKAGLAAAALTMAMPAAADVKQGVDAWQRGDYVAAVDAWRPLAMNGDPDAQFNLAQAYKLGRGVPADLAQAEYWYQRASAQGHPEAEDNYGLVLFQRGRQLEAMPWLEKSAARGEPRAEYILGTALFNGDLVTKDWTRAYALMARAAAAGLPQATKSLAQMDGFIPLDQRQRAVALARDVVATRTPAAPAPAIAVPASLPATSKPAGAPYPIPSEATASNAAAKPTPVPSPATSKPVALAAAATKPEPKATTAVTPVVKASVTPAAKLSTPPSAATWRVQLGAFVDAGRAKALWGTLQPKVKGLGAAQPYYVKAGALTRLQAGPFADKAGAERQCAALKDAGQACMAVKP